MSVSSNKNAGTTSQVTLPIAIAAVVLLVLFVGWIAYKNFAPPSMPPAPPKSSNALRMDKLFKDSGGDLDKLSAEDRQWLHQYSGGREQEAFSSLKAQVQATPH